MNRREALRSLVGGCAAGALAAAGVSLAVPVTVATEATQDVEQYKRVIELFRRLGEAKKSAVLAMVEADVEGTDPTEAVYAALGEEKGAAFLLYWRVNMTTPGPNSWQAAEVE